jgi:trans-aconitate methyltransferase
MENDGTTWDARLYEEKHAFVWKQAESLVELLAPRPGESILDLGCGTGHLTAQIASAGVSVLGIDSSGEMIEEARRSYPGLRFDLVDARHLAYVDQFDAVFSNAVLHWINEPHRVVQGISRALKPGGRFVAEFGGKGNVKAILAAVQNALQAVGCSPVDSPWFFPSVAEYAALLESAGLEVTFATLFDRPTPLEGARGMRHWVEMFGGHFLCRVPETLREEFFFHVEDELRPVLFRDDSWFADYRRLRVAAQR